MFVFEENYEFDWPVTVKMPAADGEVKQTFTVRFRLPEDEAEAVARLEGETNEELIEASRARIARYVAGWADIGTPDGKPLPFSAEALARLLKRAPFRIALEIAFGEAALGIREKN